MLYTNLVEATEQFLNNCTIEIFDEEGPPDAERAGGPTPIHAPLSYFQNSTPKHLDSPLPGRVST